MPNGTLALLGHRKRDKTLRQQELIEAANSVFAEHGYDCATTREIAERAGCSEGLIHRYFAGKRGLLLAILESKAAHVVDDFAAVMPDQPTVQAELESLLNWHLEAMWERRDFMRVAVSQATIDHEIGLTIGRDINQPRVDLMAEKLRRHQTAGRIRPDVNVDSVAHAIAGLGFAEGFIFQACFGGDRDIARRIMKDTAAALARGIVPDQTEGDAP